MANPEHRQILSQGVAVWNEWRGKRTITRPDLSHSDLSHADLRNVNLNYSDLSWANLSEANLTGANCRHTCFSYPRLSGANLTKANLFRADLLGSDLSHANLCCAELWAVLIQTRLLGANFSYVRCLRTTFSRVDLTGVPELESAHHLGTAILGPENYEVVERALLAHESAMPPKLKTV